MAENLSKKPKYDQDLATSASILPEDQNLQPQITEIYEKDLPLLANIKEFQVLHHLLQFQFDFDSKIVKCTAIYMIKSLTQDQDQDVKHLNCPKNLILDCCSLKVHKVQLISTNYADLPEPGQDMKNFYKSREIDWFTIEAIKNLNFKMDKWSITISGLENTYNSTAYVIRISYDTLPSTDSIQWRSTTGFSYSHGRKASYTPASPINNRGLFPTQEHPTAMSTWELFVILDQKDQQVLCTSDEEGLEVQNENDQRKMYFYTNHRLPSSNFAIVIGNFLHHDVKLVEGPVVSKFHSFLPIKDEIIVDMKKWIKAILTVCDRLLGPLPFPRLDLVVMPRSFSNLGLSSPYLIFLSHSNLTGHHSDLTYSCNQFFYSKIAHEISHFFFGLSVGALDWTEEWLSEGFATFIEILIYKQTLVQLNPQINREDLDEELEVTRLLRLVSLQNELDIPGENSQYQKLLQDQDHGVRNDDKVVVNGLVPEKKFHSVHYLKGYFLLQTLNQQVVVVDSKSDPDELFLAFLKHYVTKFKGQLVTSDIFLHEYFAYFTNICSDYETRENFQRKDAKLEIELIKRDWLTSTSLPEPYCKKIFLQPAQMDTILSIFSKCSKSLQKIFDFYENPQSKKVFTPNEFILLLEKVLEKCDRIVLKSLYNKYFKECKEYNSEIMHRWCEIILKYLDDFDHILEYQNELGRLFEYIKDFLLNNPSMGVYLYGELMISEKASLQKMAKELFIIQKEVLDPATKSVLKDMIF